MSLGGGWAYRRWVPWEDDNDDDDDNNTIMELRMRILELETENQLMKTQVENQKAMLMNLQDAMMQATMRSDMLEIATVDETPLNSAIARGEYEMVVALLDKDSNDSKTLDTALQCACRYRREDVVDLLLQQGANIHADHDCSLMWACQSGDAGIVSLLMKHGADPTVLHGLPMRIGIGSGNVEVVRALTMKRV